jgi:hypothetical protein
MLSGILSGVITILVVGGIVYLIFRPKGDNNHKDLKDAYFYFISFVGLMFVFWAVADFIRVVLEQNVFSPAYTYSYYSANSDAYLRKISLRISTFIVAFPVYAFHWFKANFKPEEKVDKRHKRMYLIAVLISTAVLTLGTGVGLVYSLMNFILGVSVSSNTELAYLIPYSFVSIGVWAIHYLSYHKLENKNESSPVMPSYKSSADSTHGTPGENKKLGSEKI